MRIGVDIMGGDFVPHAPIEGAVIAKKELGDDVTLVLVGDQSQIENELRRQNVDLETFEIVHAADSISMKESPTRAIAQKPQSSINIGLRLVKEKNIDAFVSAGNTGAMLVGSIMGLGKIEGVTRPTIGVLFPNHKGKLSLLCDVGANVDSKPETLLHFGVLGSTFMKAVRNIPEPQVALLNIGEEESKGPQVLQAAYQLMKDSPDIQFAGNVEGRDIYTGVADVIVTDGYAGNIVLKFAESFYEIFSQRIPNDDAIQTFNFENYGGVPILGIKGISIIGHGISTGKAIAKMIQTAAEATNARLIEQIETAFAALHQQ